MLRYTADLRTIFFVCCYFGLLTFLWLWEPPSLWVAAPVYAALLLTSFQGAVATHNSVHCPVFVKRWMNKVFQVVLSLTYGHPVSSYVPGHNLSHHKHTQSRRDVMRTTKARFRYNLLNLFMFMPVIAKDIMRADGSYAKMMRSKHPRWFRQLILETAVLWGVQIALFVIDWRKALVLWLIPHLYAQWGIVTMNLLQHDGCDQNTEYDHSRNFVGRFVNWWVYNNGYHTIHHMKPGLHWSLLPAAHAKQVAPHIHPNLDQPSMALYVLKTFVLGRRQSYDGTAFALPAEGPDEDWMPDPRTTLEDLGAESLDSAHGGLASYVAHRPAIDSGSRHSA